MSVQVVTLVLATLVLTAALPARSVAEPSRPFRVSNLSPPIAVTGLPLWSAVPEQLEIGLSMEIANHYRLREKAGDHVILDGETLRLRARVEKPFGDGWSFGVDVPFLRQSGGVLDDLVDGWHSLFNLPDGSRNARPEGVLEYDIGDSNGQFFGLHESASGIGDIQLSLAKELGSDSGWVVRGSVKLPTGREQALAGSGGTDVSIGVLYRREATAFNRAAGVYYGLGLLDVEQPDNIRFPVEDTIMTGIIGGGLTLGARFGVKAQIDVHSALFDSQLEEIGQTSVMATVGGWLRLRDDTLFEFAVCEDLHVSTTPDVVLVFSLRRVMA